MLLPGPLRRVLRGVRGGDFAPQGPARQHPARANGGPAAPDTRPSRGLEEFFGYIHGQSGLNLLDLGGASQQNISFITSLGHRFCSADFLNVIGEASDPEGTVDQSHPERIDYFLRQTLDFPEQHFDGVLIWDVLEYLEPALLAAVMERLHYIVRPGSHMLAFFHADDKLATVPHYAFRILDTRTLQVAQHGARRPAQLFNNRRLERLFGGATSVKFFLSRDRLREVVVKD